MAFADLPAWDAEITDGSSTVRIVAAGRRAESFRRVPRGQGVEPKEISQSSWVGGRGAAVLSADPDKFSDSYNAWTHNQGQFTPGPLVRWASIANEAYTNKYHYSANWPGDGFRQQYRYRPFDLLPGHTLAVKKADTGDTDISTPCRIIFLGRGDFSAITIGIQTDSASRPSGSYVASSTGKTSGESGAFSYCYAELLGGTIGSNQWVTFYNNGATTVTILCGDTDVTLPSYEYTGAAWVTAYPAYYTVIPEPGGYSGTPSTIVEYPFKVRYFEHLDALYAVRRLNVYVNGDRGAFTSLGGSVVTIFSVAGGSWTTNCFRGCVFKGVGGPSYKIVANDATTLTFERDHSFPGGAGAIQGVILGSERFRHVATMSAAATDISVCNNGVYFAHDDGTDVEKFRWNTGTNLHNISADAGSRAYLLKSCVRAGKVRLYRAWTSRKKFSYAEPGDDIFAAALTWNTDSPIAHDDARAQQLLDYDGAIWATTESDVYSIQDTGYGDISTKRPGPSERPIKDDSNGRGAAWWNTNLYFGYMDGFMRLYGRTVDDIGPNRDDGLPLDRRGIVVSAQPVFGFMASAISSDNAEGWISTIMATPAPGGAWHELWRGLRKNYTLDNLYYQNIPLLSNRLWFSHGGHPCYMFMPNTAQNPLQDTPTYTTSPYPGMCYSPGAVLKTAWVDFDTPELEKDWHELRTYGENLGGYPYGTIKPTMTIWPTTSVGLVDITSAPYVYQNINSQGNRAQLQWVLDAQDARVPPILRSFTLRAVQMNEVRYDILIDFEHANLMQLNNGADAVEAVDQTAYIKNILDYWQEKSTRLTLTTKHPVVGTVTGHIEPVPFTLMSNSADDSKIQGQIVFRQV